MNRHFVTSLVKYFFCSYHNNNFLRILSTKQNWNKDKASLGADVLISMWKLKSFVCFWMRNTFAEVTEVINRVCCILWNVSMICFWKRNFYAHEKCWNVAKVTKKTCFFFGIFVMCLIVTEIIFEIIVWWKSFGTSMENAFCECNHTLKVNFNAKVNN